MAEAPRPPSQALESVLIENRVFPPSEDFTRRAHLRGMEDYRRLWDEAAKDPEAYWGARAREELYWKEPFQTVLDWKPPHVRWFVEGRTNLAIARKLVLSGGAVEKHVANVFAKLDLPAGNEGHRRVLAVLTFLRS